jgi:tRNA (adenine57-N1/adenine58-N1)-methyltransferase
MIAERDTVLLIDKKGKKYMVQCTGSFHTHYGVLDLTELVGKEYGMKVKTHRGDEFIVIKPNFIDYIEKMRKMPQIIQPKDAAMIVAETGLTRGSTVVEAGIGSGGLTVFLAAIISPGTISSYEIRKEFASVAEKNIENFGLDNVRIKLQDIYDGIDEREVDLVVLDLPEPEKVMESAYKALKWGGFICAYTPSLEQMMRFRRRATEFFHIKTIETLVREYEHKKMGTRPRTFMVGHTGFLTFGRKIR